MSEEIIRSVLLKAGFKTFFVFLVVTTLDYFVDESDLLDQVNDFGFKNTKQLRYELVEKILVKLPKKYQKLSCVVIDGKFLCIDPYIGTNLHLLSHVKFSKIAVQNKKVYNFDKKKILLKKKNEHRLSCIVVPFWSVGRS